MAFQLDTYLPIASYHHRRFSTTGLIANHPDNGQHILPDLSQLSGEVLTGSHCCLTSGHFGLDVVAGGVTGSVMHDSISN